MSWMLSCIGCGTQKLPEREEARFLDFQHCLLKTVPFEVFLNERILQELLLDSNQISELPRELFHCHELCILSLSDNELQNLPAAVSSLINLQSLNFCKNGISDLPDSINACKKLARVDASTNPLCRIPEGVTQLVALRELCLNDTFLDYLPANFGRLIGLEVLELRENQLNTLPRSMIRLTALRRLDIGQNEYFELPEVVGHLTNLTDLCFDGNKIKSIPFDIGNLTELSFIDASRNRIREVCPEIGSCKKLVDFYLNSNELEVLPDELCECKHLSSLSLDENIIGQLPENLGEIEQLTELNISHNELIDLPSSIGLLRELSVLHVDHNMLGQLPLELGSCSNLIILTAAHNQITHLPPELANILRLKVINVCGNQIEFLPVSFTKLMVTGLWLSDNQTKPTVPMQCKIDVPSGRKVLTCYMLPQMPYEEKVYKDDSNDLPIAESEVAERRARSLIHFASDEDRHESGLSRTPTPYPKELRALARHTKNLKSLHKANISNQVEMVPTLSPIKQQTNQDTLMDGSTHKDIVPNPSTEDEQVVVAEEPIIPSERERPSSESVELNKLVEKFENLADVSQNILKDYANLDNIVPTTRLLQSEIHQICTDLKFSNSAECIATGWLEKPVGSHCNYDEHNANWKYVRPGSLDTTDTSENATLTPKFLDSAVHAQNDTTEEANDHGTVYKAPSSVDSGSIICANEQNNTREIELKSSEDNNETFAIKENFTVDKNQTKIPLYSPFNITCDQVSPQKSTISNTLTPAKSQNSKIAYQSRLPTLGTPNKVERLRATAEAPDDAGKSRLPTLSPQTKSMKSQENNSSRMRIQNMKIAEAPISFESRIPSFSAKHSTYGISPVQKPINTTGIPSISPQSRDSVTNSCFKKKSSIPLSRYMPIGTQISPAERELKNPHDANEAWK